MARRTEDAGILSYGAIDVARREERSPKADYTVLHSACDPFAVLGGDGRRSGAKHLTEGGHSGHAPNWE